jgi:thiamine biosynthesis lipoprotein
VNRRGNHIVDARTGATPEALASVTVIHDSLTWADIDATAAFALGRDGLTWLSTRPGRIGLVVWQDGTRQLYGGTPGKARGSRAPCPWTSSGRPWILAL